MNSHYRWTTNVICYGKNEVQSMLMRLKELGYQFISGSEIDPADVSYTARKMNDDDSITWVTRYAVNEQTKTVAFNSYIAMQFHHRNGKKREYSLAEFLTMTNDQLKSEVENE